jgi:hypothetical protein
VWTGSFALTQYYNWEGVWVTAWLAEGLERFQCVNGGGGENKSCSKQLPPYLIYSCPHNPSLPRQRKFVIIIWFWYHLVSKTCLQLSYLKSLPKRKLIFLNVIFKIKIVLFQKSSLDHSMLTKMKHLFYKTFA